MKKQVVFTKNVRRALAAVKAIVETQPGIPKYALIYGEPGLGKTETGLFLMNQYFQDGGFVRVKKISSARWLLQDIVSELGVVPAYKSSDLFEQAIEALIGTNKVMFYDEVDYLAADSRVLLTLMDLHDLTQSPAVFLGMNHADKKLKRFPHLWRRFSQVVKFEPLDVEDVKAAFEAICEVEIEPEVYQAIMSVTERRSDRGIPMDTIYKWALKFERYAKRAKAGKITKDIALRLSNGGGNGIGS